MGSILHISFVEFHNIHKERIWQFCTDKKE